MLYIVSDYLEEVRFNGVRKVIVHLVKLQVLSISNSTFLERPPPPRRALPLQVPHVDNQPQPYNQSTKYYFRFIQVEFHVHTQFSHNFYANLIMKYFKYLLFPFHTYLFLKGIKLKIENSPFYGVQQNVELIQSKTFKYFYRYFKYQ